MIRLTGVLALAWLLPQAAQAQRAANAADATVFIRTVGERRALVGDVRQQTAVERDVQLGTGSGFVVSPFGYVVTNYHVIAERTVERQVRGVPVQVTLTPRRLEVIFPTGLPGQPESAPRLDASVYAVDAERDLAVLLIAGGGFPYLALGDSDAIAPGADVTALGFPFGRMVEVARAGVPDVVPQVNVSRGEISALRADVDGQTGYLQTSATLNPGNSGGPLLDANGFVVGIVRMVLTRGRGIGFGIPVNTLKAMLRTHGLAGMLPTPSLPLAPSQTLPGKGLRLAMPVGFEDAGATRLRVDAAASDGDIALRIDRVATPLTLEQLRDTLLQSRTLEQFLATSTLAAPGPSGRPRLVGSATGRDPFTRTELGLAYAIVGLAHERIVARYIGPLETIAYNRGVLLESLAGLDVAALRTAPLRQAPALEWVATPLASPGAPQVTLPAGWPAERGAPWACNGLPAPHATLSASPPGDFTVSLRVAWWAQDLGAARAATACATLPQGATPNAYATATDWLGVRYEAEGVFVDLGDNGMMQIEVGAPASTMPMVRGLLNGWADPR